MSAAVENATPLAATGHDGLHDLLHHLEHVLPAQAPIKDFVHHNTLHGFQHLPFREALAAAEAASGAFGDPSPEAFRDYFAQGRIDLTDLNAALDETPELAPDQIVAGDLRRRDALLAALRFDLAPLPEAVLDWRLRETPALARVQPGVADRARARLLEDSPEAEALERLWLACQAVLGVDPAAGAAAPVTPAALDAAADAALAGLLDGFGAGLSLRGLLLRLTGRDLMDGLRPYLIRHLASHLDLGLAAWHHPDRPRGFYAAWRQSAVADPHFGLAELGGWDLVLERLPEAPLACIAQELRLLGLAQDRGAAYLEGLAKELPGWSGMVLWRHTHPGYEGEPTPVALADYLAVRLVLERIYAQPIVAAHFKVEASLDGLRGYLRRHPAECLVRLALFAEAGGLPEYLQEQGHRLVREATGRAGEELDADWRPVARLIQAARPLSATEASQGAGRGPAWRLFLLCQHLGLGAGALARLGPEAARALLACVADLDAQRMGWVWLQAYERHYRQQVLGALAANVGRGPWKQRPSRPSAQLVFCMDDREEGLRRHLEELSPQVETLGAAAHFNVPHAWRGLDDASAVALCPVVPTVVVPAHEVREVPSAGPGQAAYPAHAARRRQRLAWKARLHQGTRLGLVTPLLMSLAAAPLTLGVLAGKAFAPGALARLAQRLRRGFEGPVPTEIAFTAPNDSPAADPAARRLGFTDVEQADRVQTLLRNTGLTFGFSPLVVIMGHASHSQNNPHASAYNCGACAGRYSGPNARLVSAMANRPAVRALLAQRGIAIPDDAWFIGSEHDTCDDTVTWYDEVLVPEALRPALAQLQANLTRACQLHAQERCRRFMSAPLNLTPEAAWRHVAGRASDFGQARPELGHATNASAFIGRRAFSRGAFFDRRAFLISYDPSQDPQGEVLERHLVINGAVGAGISLEYYFSSANNERYGCSTKVMHNVSGQLGVMEGAASDLRTGLPRQMIEVHEAMRLLVVVEHTLDVLTAIYQRQPAVQELVKNAWVQLVALDPDSGELHRFVVGTGWVKWQPDGPAPATVRRSADWALGKREALAPALIEQGVTP